jgi:hypothetical protein
VQVAKLATAGQQTTVLRGESPSNWGARPGDIVVIPGRGLQLPPRLPFEGWIRVGERLTDIHSSSAWCLGDWLVYGVAAYSGRYREAIEQTSLDYQTLRNYAWVARRFELSRRRDSLSFGHHSEVAALPEAEQDFWLRKAHEFGWTVKQLRREVRASHSERSPGDGGQIGRDSDASHGRELAQEPQRPAARLSIPVTRGRLESYRAAAAKADFALGEWAVLALDRAATADAEGAEGDSRLSSLRSA